jgi:endonuclease/exonuclease/phosphatase family metal-dependent hydrolase
MGILSIGYMGTWAAALLALGWHWRRVALRRLRWVALALWLAGGWWARPAVGWGSRPAITTSKPAGTLRLVQWNCMQLPGIEQYFNKHLPWRYAMVQHLRRLRPDVLLLQDFQNYQSDVLWSNISLLRDSLGFRYMHFASFYHEKKAYGVADEGVAIFSRLPLVDTGRVAYSGRRHNSYIAWADVLWQGQRLRLASTHFKSMSLHQEPAPGNSFSFVHYEDTAILTKGDKLPKLRKFQAYHVQQAATLRRFMDSCQVPLVLGADMNSVPTSWVYQHVSPGWQDAWLQAGRGLGGTYKSSLPQLRIDYLLLPPRLQLQQFSMFELDESDHRMLMADIQWRE